MSQIKSLQSDLSKLHSLKNKRILCGKTIAWLNRKYNIRDDSDISTACEIVLQGIRAYACRLKRYESSLSFSRHNWMFKHHQHDFFDQLSSPTKGNFNPPPLEATLKFWKELWGTPCQHSTSILPHIVEVTGSVDPMTTPIISTELFEYAVSRIKNWKAPGPDCLHGYWIKHLQLSINNFGHFTMIFFVVIALLIHGCYKAVLL